MGRDSVGIRADVLGVPSAGFLAAALFVGLTVFLPSRAFAQVAMAPKQLFVVKPGVDRVYGTWVAAVMNRGTKPERYRVSVVLPKEAKDFRPLEGVTPDELKLDGDGLSVEKEFNVGVNVISLAFEVPANHGQQTLHIKARADIGELTVMTPKGLLAVTGAELVDAGSDVEDMQRYMVMTTSRAIVAGDELAILIEGIPQGRESLWVLGGVFGLLVAGSAGFLAWRSRPRMVAIEV